MNDVTIKIKGLQVIEETGDTIETMVSGKHYIKNNKHYLLYDEIDEESCAKTKNTIKFTDKYAEVTRKGNISGKLIFEQGKNNQSLYSTPFGEMLIEILTKEVKIKEEDKKIKLDIDYEIYANNSKVSDSKINITAQTYE